jgi:hypothetical protein
MKKNIFYQVKHKGVVVGSFKKKKNAEKYAKEFTQEIGGYDYPVEIIKKDFLDEMYENDS